MDRYIQYQLDQGRRYDIDQRQQQEERFLPPTDEQVKATLARKEAKDGPKPD